MFDGIDTGTQRLERTFGALHMRGDQDVLAVRFVYDRGDLLGCELELAGLA